MEVKKKVYYDSDCKETHCALCTISTKVHFLLRGLPKEYSKINNSNDGIDSNYIFIAQHDEKHTSDISSIINLRGYFDHGIRSNRTKNGKKVWEISWHSSSHFGNTQVGYLIGDQHGLPFGKRRWKLSRRDLQQEQEEVLLKLSAVSKLIRSILLNIILELLHWCSILSVDCNFFNIFSAILSFNIRAMMGLAFP